jgi:tight adherence protein B
MAPSLLSILAFFSGFLLVAGVNWALSDIVDDRRRRAREKLAAELIERQADRARLMMANQQVYEQAAAGVVDPDAGMSAANRIRQMLLQAGLQMRLQQLLLLSLILTVGTGSVVGYFSPWPWVFLPVSLVAGLIPVVVIRLVRNFRRNKLKKQLPEAFEMMARVLRAGQTISQAMRGVAEQFPSPIAEEFSLCWEQQNLGLSPEASFRELGRRTGLLEIKIFVVALSIHRQTGGNLSALLMKLSNVIRERMKLEDKVGALTAEGKMQAYVLLGMPFIVSAMVYFLHPTYFEPILAYPQIFVFMLVMLVVGWAWMQKIIHFDF